MQRICGSLAMSGYDVLLIGRKKTKSVDLEQQPFRQKRLNSWFQYGPGLYIEYNFRLFFFLLFCKMDVICAIDLDTILPCYFVSIFRKKKRVYDAHELFTEMKEIVSRPLIRKWWMAVERFAVPKFSLGYTVNDSLVKEFKKRYEVDYGVVRNLPKYEVTQNNVERGTRNNESQLIIYQGAVNEGRSFETIIPAIQQVDGWLLICGDGNFFEQTKQLVKQYGVEEKVEMRGYVAPDELKQITPTARVALMVFESTGINQYNSLSNRFFDYIMAGVPQVCVNYPEYKAINDQYHIALMIDDTKAETIAQALNTLITDNTLYEQLRQNCFKARQALNWNSQEKGLIAFYQKLLTAQNVEVSDTTDDAIKN